MAETALPNRGAKVDYLKGASRRVKRLSCTLLAMLMVLGLGTISWAQPTEETYTIDLVKNAEMKEDIAEVGDQKVLTETHVVKKGDHLWQLLREKGLLDRKNLPEILSMLKRLNKDLQNLDMIQPGEKIIIPLKIVPLSAAARTEPGETRVEAPEKSTPEALGNMNLEDYTVMPGDSLTRVVSSRYGVPADYLYGEYLQVLKRLNPAIKDLNRIYPGQTIRLPIYSPQQVRSPIAKRPEKTQTRGHETPPFVDGIKQIFLAIGEEWVQTGQHFIPLPSGGQIDLKADSFPLLSLRNGRRIIIDQKNQLPDQMTHLIESSWGQYSVVHLVDGDNLRTALERVFAACDYPKVLRNGAPYEIDGPIQIKIRADWVVVLAEKPSETDFSTIVINLDQGQGTEIPWTVKDYLKTRGIKVIDYPGAGSRPHGVGVVEATKAQAQPKQLIETLLGLLGRTFSKDLDIPVFTNQAADLTMTVRADFFLKVGDRDAIIDLTGFSKTVVSFLGTHDFLVLSLGGDQAPMDLVRKTLGFLGVPFDGGPLSLMASEARPEKSVELIIPGVTFQDGTRNKVFMTSGAIPDEIAAFMSGRQYRIVVVS
jgi:LysM repeat protein